MTVKTFAEKVGANAFILWAHFPVAEFFNGAPMIGFNTDDNKDAFMDVFYAPLFKTEADSGGIIQASYGSLTGMNFILFDKELNWLIYMDYRTSIGIFHCDSPRLKETFESIINADKENEYQLHETDVREMISEIYDLAEIEKFEHNYLD